MKTISWFQSNFGGQLVPGSDLGLGTTQVAKGIFE